MFEDVLFGMSYVKIFTQARAVLQSGVSRLFGNYEFDGLTVRRECSKLFGEYSFCTFQRSIALFERSFIEINFCNVYSDITLLRKSSSKNVSLYYNAFFLYMNPSETTSLNKNM